jgi:tRNA(Ile)-lysidine synthase
MLNNFISFVEIENLVGADTRTLLAVSGGADSVVMAELFHMAGFQFGIAHVNFKLRAEESDRDELFVRNLAERFKVKIFVRHFETDKFARQNKLSIQVAARQLRYEWFNELVIKHGYDRIATAHHLDDQVETFLINLARGTGIAGLHGIPLRQGKIIRPMMFTGRREIEAYARANNIDFVQDSSNLSVKYTRNRIRLKVIPQLELVNPAFRQELIQTISHIRDAEIIYRQTVDQKRKEILHRKGDEFIISADQFYSLKPLTTWAFELLSPFGFNQANIKDIIGMADAIPGKEVHSTTHRLIKDRDQFIIAPRGNTGLETTFLITTEDLAKEAVKFPLNIGFETLHEIPAEYADPAITAYLDLDRLDFPLLIRKWKRGDFFYPMGMPQRKKLSDFFTDQKFSIVEKEKQWLICSGKDIAWVIGYRIDDRFKITSATRRVLKITICQDLVNGEIRGNSHNSR